MRDPTDNFERRIVLIGLGSGIATIAGCLDDDPEEPAAPEDDEVDDDIEDDAEPADDDVEDDEEPVDEDDDVEEASLVVTAVWTEGEQEDFNAVLDHVSEQTGHEIEYHPRDTEELLTGTRMDFEAGTTPADIVVFPSSARVQTDGDAGHLEDVSGVWDPEDFATAPDPVSVDDGVFAAPFGMDLKPGFWYRLSFFDEHGLSEPTDYDEFIALLDEIDDIEDVEAPLASGNGVGWPLSDVVEAYILRQENGADLQEDLIAGEAAFTDDRVYTAFEEVQETLQAGYWSELREFGVQYEHFWENSIPLYFMGSWTPAFGAIEDPDDLGYFSLPGVEAWVAAINWLVVPTYGENIDASMDALEHIVSADGQRVWVERGGFIPSNEEISPDAFEIDVMAQLLDDAGEMRLVDDLDDALGDPFQSSFWAQLLGLWTEPDSDIDSIIATLDDAHQETVGNDDEEA